MARATGTFDVKLVSLATPDAATGEGIDRRSIDKRFHGDLDATSAGEMMAMGTAANGSGTYVAIERVTGTLHGRTGSFLLAHRGTMSRTSRELSVVVGPESGTGELVGLAGTLAIEIANGVHAYVLEYTLPGGG